MSVARRESGERIDSLCHLRAEATSSCNRHCPSAQAVVSVCTSRHPRPRSHSVVVVVVLVVVLVVAVLMLLLLLLLVLLLLLSCILLSSVLATTWNGSWLVSIWLLVSKTKYV